MSSDGGGEELRCAVCNDRTTGNHFGVTSCRACAAFFRRSTVSNRRYVCRFGDNCDIGRDIRCCCRACRMRKCREVGMRPDLARGARGDTPTSGGGGHVRSSDSIDSTGNVTPPNLENQTQPLQFGLNPPVTTYVDTTSGAWTIPLGTTTTIADMASTSHNNVNDGRFRSVEENGRTLTLLEPAVNSSTPSTSIPSVPLNLDFSKPNSYHLLIESALSRIREMTNSNTHMNDALFNPGQDNNASKSILQQMIRGYKMLEQLRQYGRGGHVLGNILNKEQMSLSEGNYIDDMECIRSDLPLVSQMINNHFYPISQFSLEVKWALLRNFFCPFIMAERAFRTARYIPENEDQWLLISNEKFINYRAMDKFCDVPNCKIEPARLAQIITPTSSKILTILVKPMRKLQLSEEEFVGLIGLLFWNDTLTSLSEDETRQVFQVQEQLISELCGACARNAPPNTDATSRMGVVVNLVPLCVRLANEMSNCFSLVNMTHAFDFDHFLTAFMPQLI
ncbi:unnamed protein product [Bursaphelenchus xylophilus]|uniref:(pine wood nematode) hypothetical protein n=1 Tax=Bursaphelenchus xylophilus TaxID=6326 RepID=A0A1I7S443_BURXY|nr:unnamed protein product [Bursaphelenchus xylophilus]CAG9116703.1 unnamed protein product [Bursaphelenchus xylophilus]